MNRYARILSTVVLSALSLSAAANTNSVAEQQAALHAAMGAQARASKDFGMAAHCARLVRDNEAGAATSPATVATAGDHKTLAAAAEEQAEAHRTMLRTASFSRDSSMASHCRALVAKYTAEAAVHRELSQTSR